MVMLDLVGGGLEHDEEITQYPRGFDPKFLLDHLLYCSSMWSLYLEVVEECKRLLVGTGRARGLKGHRWRVGAFGVKMVMLDLGAADQEQ